MLKSCEAFFVYTHLNMASLIPFTKRFESSENLVDLLESRGLQICDRNKAIQYLDNIGYYRLSAYMYPLLKMPKTAHLYKEGSTFKKVMMLYRFDKKLRLLMFNEIEKIEIAIRRAVMQITADMTGNPFWLTDSSYFLDSSKFNEIGQTLYNDNIIWTEQVYGRTDFTPSRSSAIKDYNYYLGNWKISTAQQYNWTGSKWENKFSKMEFNIRIEENIKNESYYVYGWAPYGKLLEQYPLTMLYTNSDTNPLSIPMPQVLHYSDATDPLMWKMCWATPGRTANSWTVGGKEGEFRAILNSDGSITLKPFPFNDNRNCTAVPYCSNDGGNTWLYTHTIFQEAHPTGLNYELTKQ